jgi:hypothetical protein
MLKRECTFQVGQGSDAAMPITNEVFGKLWKVQCPPKVYHFFWRLAHNSHPVFMNIARRGVDLDTRCAVCHKFFEDGGHLFLKTINLQNRDGELCSYKTCGSNFCLADQL